MRNIITGAIIVTVFAVAYWIGYNDGQKRITQTRDHDDARLIQCKLADMRARIETLEQMDIDVNVIDHTGVYSVFGVQTK